MELSSVIVKKGVSDKWKNHSDCFAYAKIGEFTIEKGIKDFGMNDMFDGTEIGIMRWPGELKCANSPFTANIINQPEYIITDLYYGGSEAEWNQLQLENLKKEKIKNYHFCEHINTTEIVGEDGLKHHYCPECGRIWDPLTFGSYENDDTGMEEAYVDIGSMNDSVFIIPAGWNGLKVTDIAPMAFAYNTKVKQIFLPETIMYIEMSAFEKCTNLSLITIPESTVLIDEDAFSGVSSEINIIYSGTKEQWDKIEIADGNDILNTNVTICSHSQTSIINAVAKTCTTDGYTGDIQCDVCKKIIEQGNVISAGHTPVIDAAVAPTCTETGLTEGSHCEVCDTVLVAQTVIPTLGHDYTADYTVDTAPTCTAAGSQSRHCTRCGASDETSKQEVAALGHDYVSKVTTAPTCTKDGVQTDTCSRCGDVQTTALKATGHQWSNWTKISDATVFATEQQQRTCQTCGEKETKEVGATLAPTSTVNASTVTLKVKQSTKGLKVTDLAAGDSVASWKSDEYESIYGKRKCRWHLHSEGAEEGQCKAGDHAGERHDEDHHGKGTAECSQDRQSYCTGEEADCTEGHKGIPEAGRYAVYLSPESHLYFFK